MRFHFVIIFFLIVGCKGESTYRLSDAQYVDLMTDIEIFEALLENKSGYEKDSLSTVYYTMLSKKHGLSEAEIKTEVTNLFNNPQKTEAILQEVSKKLETIKDTLRVR